MIYDTLYKAIGYQFNNQSLLTHALRHRSAKGESNERLEFLGDSVLNFVIAAELFKRYPRLTEGQLSRVRSILVKRDTLAELAIHFQLGRYLQLGVGENKSGGANRQSILADALEAIIGAIYLDSGPLTCAECLHRWYEAYLNKASEMIHDKDAKTTLQEYLQANKHSLPEYRVGKVEGDDHSQTFHIACTVPHLDYEGKGVGSSRRKAEQAAAEDFLIWLFGEVKP